ncbi:hypothetical protein C8J57DRAFT_1536839 [Mycena rebaudengoi]|nr:hypothetical protein C8J57DRAFT_1536839 [Mycena rebaudengoi]
MQVWFVEEWAIHNLAVEQADCYQFKLLQGKLVEVWTIWDKTLPNLGLDVLTLPMWGPSTSDLVQCTCNAYRPGRGEGRGYEHLSDNEDDGMEEMAGDLDEEDIEILEAVVRAEVYREVEIYID